MCNRSSAVTENCQDTLTFAIDKILCIQRSITSGTLAVQFINTCQTMSGSQTADFS